MPNDETPADLERRIQSSLGQPATRDIQRLAQLREDVRAHTQAIMESRIEYATDRPLSRIELQSGSITADSITTLRYAGDRPSYWEGTVSVPIGTGLFGIKPTDPIEVPPINWSKKFYHINNKRLTLPRRMNRKQKRMAQAFLKRIAKAHPDFWIEKLRCYFKNCMGIQTDAQVNIRDIRIQYFHKDKYVEDPLVTKGKNAILERFRSRFSITSNEDDTNLVPLSKLNAGKVIGIEIECLSPHSRAEIVALYNQRPKKIANFKIGTDGSVSRTEAVNGNGYEFRILTRVDDMSNLLEACAFLAEIKAKVNGTCGLHVHLDARLSLRHVVNMVRNLKTSLPFLNSMVPHRRREGNSYCRGTLSWDKKRKLEAVSASGKKLYTRKSRDRYAKINTMSFQKYHTIEVRMHSGTVLYSKISAWVKILHSIAHMKDKANFVPSVDGYATRLNWKASLTDYALKRVALFKDEAKLAKTYAPKSDAEKVKVMELKRHENEWAQLVQIDGTTLALSEHVRNLANHLDGLVLGNASLIDVKKYLAQVTELIRLTRHINNIGDVCRGCVNRHHLSGYKTTLERLSDSLRLHEANSNRHIAERFITEHLQAANAPGWILRILDPYTHLREDLFINDHHLQERSLRYGESQAYVIESNIPLIRNRLLQRILNITATPEDPMPASTFISSAFNPSHGFFKEFALTSDHIEYGELVDQNLHALL